MRPCYCRFPPGAAAGLVWACCLVGCHQFSQPLTPAGSLLSADGERTPALRDSQVADVQVALGRSLEHSGDLARAQAAYQEALNHDPARADACERLAVVCDRQG